MKKLLFSLVLFTTFSLQAQTKKEDSLVLQITMDTATFKNVVQLIRENINSQTLSGKLLLESVLSPLYNFKFVPREQPKPQPANKEKNK